MTVEEVRNQLEELIRDRESFMVGDYDKDIYDRDKEALEFAVKAVEKQIPQKLKNEILQVNIQGYLYMDKCYICPLCGIFRGNADYQPEKIIKYQFCPNCGQALDWSGDDE